MNTADLTDLIHEAQAYFDAINPRLRKLREAGISKELRMRNTSNIVVTYPTKQDTPPSGPDFLKFDFTGADSTLYVHIPFCTGICSYCGFTRTAVSDTDSKIRRYLSLLEKEARLLRAANGDRPIPVKSIYIGGGTPTLLPPSDLESLFSLLRDVFVLPPGAEYTLEGSPETITVEKIKLATTFGVNRVSIGVESFDNNMLEKIRRRHDAELVHSSLAMIRAGGIDHIDIDMIRGLPGSDYESVLTDLEGIKRADVPSVTSYQYVLRPRSLDSKSDEEKDLDPEQKIIQHLAFSLGMKRIGFEDSDRAIIDVYLKNRSFVYQHNLHKWKGQYNLIALGQGVHGYINNTTYFTYGSPAQYAESITAGRLPVEKAATLSPDDLMRRRIIFGLKTGVNLASFRAAHGVDLGGVDFWPIVETFRDLGAIELQDDEVRLTDVGALFADWIQMAFYSPEYKAKEARRLTVA